MQITSVGYGDITPKNPGETVVAMIVEFTGAIAFGAPATKFFKAYLSPVPITLRACL